MKNLRKQSKHTPYKLVCDGREYGCYEDSGTPRSIGRSLVKNDKCSTYSVYDDKDNLIERD